VPDLEEAGAKIELPVVKGGSDVDRYLAAAELAAKAAVIMEGLKPKLIALGMEAVFKHNCASVPEKRIKSAHLCGDRAAGEEPAVLLATCVNKSPKLDAKKVVAALAGAKTIEGKVPNPDRYTRYEVVAEFDAACVHDAKGRIDADRFDKVSKAFEDTAKELGIANPLSFAKKLVLTETWWEDRFDRFDKDTLVELCSSALPQQVNLKQVK